MKASEIREMTVEKIEEELDAAREELMRLRFQLTTGELTDHTRLSSTRRNIARMLTLLKEKKGVAAEEGEE
jgi:large subunit ribosomal protein L29